MRESSPRILFLTSHLPAPPISGGRRREFELLKRLSRSYDIELCVASKTYAEDKHNVHLLEGICAPVDVYPCLPAEADESVPYQIQRHRCPGVTRRVRDRLIDGDIDLIHVEGFYMMQHVPSKKHVPVVLVEQNVEYVLWRQRTEATTDPSVKQKGLNEYLLTLRDEIDAWRQATLCAAVTSEDQSTMLEAAPDVDVRVIPNGCDHLFTDVLQDRLPKGPRAPMVSFVANFAYEPNADAAAFICDEIYPLIHRDAPDAELWLVGNDPPEALVRRAGRLDRVTITGRVPNVGPYIRASDVLVCPLRVGGGIKVKVLEALALGKATVTTSIGIQGLGEEVHRCVAIEDHPAHFAAAVVRLLQDPQERRALETAAREFAATALPSWDDAAHALCSLYDDALSGRLTSGTHRSVPAG